MRTFKDIKDRYQFTPEDEQRLGSLRALMADHADEAMETLHAWILLTADTAKFFTDENRKKRVFGAHRKWFLNLFSGTYDHSYYEGLIRIGQIHVKAFVEAHYMNRAVNIFRNFCIGLINRSIGDLEERTRVFISLEKILDINLDVITSSYIEEELKTYSPSYRVKNTLLTFTEGYSQSMNFILILGLIGLTLGVIGLFVVDVYRLVTGNIEQGIITSLGSLLMLWVIIELINTEIAHLKGAKFYISVFIGVALVAIIRETMIATLKKESPEVIYYLIAAILVIGVVYWLVTKAENRSK